MRVYRSIQDHYRQTIFLSGIIPGEKRAHKHKLFALVNVQMALGQTAGCPKVNRAKKFMCSLRNAGNINFSLWLIGRQSQACPDFRKVYVFRVYVPFSCPNLSPNTDAESCCQKNELPLSESGQGGWKTQGGGKHTVNSAKNPSHLRYVFSPPPLFWATLCHFP